MNFIDPETARRVERRGITMTDIQHCLDNYTDSYIHRRDTVYSVQLEDGRNLKVAVRTDAPHLVVNAFKHF